MIKLRKFKGNWSFKVPIYNFFPSLIISEVLDVEIYKSWDLDDTPIDIKSKSVIIENSLNIKNYQILLNNNPELRELNQKYNNSDFLLDKYSNSYDIWNGAFSMFNYHDIDYFIKYDNWKKRPKDILIKQRKLEKILGVNFQWIVSENTLDIIEKRINEIITPVPYEKLKVVEDKINETYYKTNIMTP